jgi:hypothetical protein
MARRPRQGVIRDCATQELAGQSNSEQIGVSEFKENRDKK